MTSSNSAIDPISNWFSQSSRVRDIGVEVVIIASFVCLASDSRYSAVIHVRRYGRAWCGNEAPVGIDQSVWGSASDGARGRLAKVVYCEELVGKGKGFKRFILFIIGFVIGI